MKKIISLLALSLVVFGFSTMAMASTTVTYVGNSVKFESGVTPTTAYVYKATGTSTADFRGQFTSTGSNTYVLVSKDYFSKAGENSYRFVTSSTAPNCSALNYADCVSASTPITQGTLTFDFSTLKSSALAGFLSATSFPVSDTVTWSGAKLLSILGGGLGLVNALMGWIVAIIIITVIVRLIFHGLRWLHILR